MEIKKYWTESVSFQEFLKDAQKRIESPQNQEDMDKKKYYELGMQRMSRVLKTYTPDENHLQVLKEKNFKGKVLIITESWCGDSSQITPVVNAFFEGKNEVKIFYRDSDTTLIDAFLTDGARAIPKVLFLNENFEVFATWGPRPKYGLELLKKFKENPESYPREKFYNDLQVYYARNKGKDIIEEILELL